MFRIFLKILPRKNTFYKPTDKSLLWSWADTPGVLSWEDLPKPSCILKRNVHHLPWKHRRNKVQIVNDAPLKLKKRTNRKKKRFPKKKHRRIKFVDGCPYKFTAHNQFCYRSFPKKYRSIRGATSYQGHRQKIYNIIWNFLIFL